MEYIFIYIYGEYIGNNKGYIGLKHLFLINPCLFHLDPQFNIDWPCLFHLDPQIFKDWPCLFHLDPQICGGANKYSLPGVSF